MLKPLLIAGAAISGLAVLFDAGQVQMSKPGSRRGATPYRRGTIVACADPTSPDGKLVGKRVNLWGDTFANIEQLGGQLVDAQFTLRDRIAADGSGQDTWILENFAVQNVASAEEIAAATATVRHAQALNLEARGSRKVTPALAAPAAAGAVASTLLAAPPATGDLAEAVAEEAAEPTFA